MTVCQAGSSGAVELLTEVAPEGQLFASEEQHVRKRERLRVRDRQERALGAHGRKPTRGAAMKLQLRRSVTPNHLDVAPQYILRVARAERLHRRFLGREPAGKMNGRLAPLGTVGNLDIGEYAVNESVAVASDRRGDSRNVSGVDAQSDDVRHV